MVVRGQKLRRQSCLKGIKILKTLHYFLSLIIIAVPLSSISTCFPCHRVISYIKNSWENNFTEKWKDLAASNQSKPVDQTATVNCDFPESAQWVSLVDAKDDVPTFNI